MDTVIIPVQWYLLLNVWLKKIDENNRIFEKYEPSIYISY